MVIDEDYIQDDFNLTGLNSLVPYYDYALDMILDVEVAIDEGLTEEQQEVVESAAEMLYGLIHARYLVTSRGVQAAQVGKEKMSSHQLHIQLLTCLPRKSTIKAFSECAPGFSATASTFSQSGYPTCPEITLSMSSAHGATIFFIPSRPGRPTLTVRTLAQHSLISI